MNFFLKIAFAKKPKSRLYCGHPAVHIFSFITLKFSEYYLGMCVYGMNQNNNCTKIFKALKQRSLLAIALVLFCPRLQFFRQS